MIATTATSLRIEQSHGLPLLHDVADGVHLQFHDSPSLGGSRGRVAAET